MNKCEINEDLSSEMMKAFWSVYNLKVLKMKDNYMKFGGISSLAESFKVNKILWQNLHTLDIGNTWASEEEVILLAQSLVKYKSLQQLILDNNELNDTAGEELRSLAYKNQTILKLRTERNNIAKRIQLAIEEQCKHNQENAKKNSLPNMKSVVSHLIAIKDRDTDQDRCLQEILDLEKQKTHYTKEIYDR